MHSSLQRTPRDQETDFNHLMFTTASHGEPFQDTFRPELYDPYAGARYVVQTQPYEVAVKEPWEIQWEPGNEIHWQLRQDDEVGRMYFKTRLALQLVQRSSPESYAHVILHNEITNLSFHYTYSDSFMAIQMSKTRLPSSALPTPHVT